MHLQPIHLVFRLKVREKAFGINFNPIRKLHTPSATLKENSILMVWSEDDGMCRAGSVLAEDVYKHLILSLKQKLGRKFRIIGFIPYSSVRDSRVIRGIRVLGVRDPVNLPLVSWE